MLMTVGSIQNLDWAVDNPKIHIYNSMQRIRYKHGGDREVRKLRRQTECEYASLVKMLKYRWQKCEHL